MADCIVFCVQDPSEPVLKADSDWAPLLLTFVANRSNREVAMVSGAQKVYKDLKRPKGYARSFPACPVLLIHLHTCTSKCPDARPFRLPFAILKSRRLLAAGLNQPSACSAW